MPKLWWHAIVLLVLLVGVSHAANEGTIQFFSDPSCSSISGEPIVIATNVCQDADRVRHYGAKAVSFPACDSGHAVLEISDVKRCGPSSFFPRALTAELEECLAIPLGTGIASAGFGCHVPVFSSRSSKVVTTAAATTIRTSEPTALPTETLTSHPATPGPVAGGDRPAGFGLGDQIALGVGIGIGLPTFLATMWACYFGHARSRPRSRSRGRRRQGPNIGHRRYSQADQGDPPPPYSLT